MLKRIEADYRSWLGSSSAELGYTGLESQTNVHTYTHTDGSTHDVLVIDGRRDGEGPTILKSTSLDYRINPFLVRQETITAHQLGARIGISEIPGISGMPINAKGELDLSTDIDKKMSTVWQSKEEQRQVRYGAFDLIAAKQLTALSSVLGLSNYDRVELGGHSLGAMLAATMGKVAARELLSTPLVIDRIHLEDPSNLYGLSPLAMTQTSLNGRIETKRRNDTYLKENDVIGHGDVTPFERQSEENARISKYIKGHQKGTVLRSLHATRRGIHPVLLDFVEQGLRNGTASPDTVISIAHYEQSLACNLRDALSLHDSITSQGMRSEVFEYASPSDDPTELGHQTATSLGRAASIAINTPR